MGMLRRRLFQHAWEGETLALKVALIQATENWEALTGGDLPCPVVFDPEDVHETLEACRNMGCFGLEDWVPAEYYEGAMACSKQLKEGGLAAGKSEEGRVQIAAHWPLADMDEKEYM